MRYVIETYWAWLLLAFLVGNIVGYCLSCERSSVTRIGSWPFMLLIAFLIGVVIALLCWFPGRAGLYLETLLYLTFSYVIGGLIGGLLRALVNMPDHTSFRPRPLAAPATAPARATPRPVKATPVAAKVDTPRPAARAAISTPKAPAVPVQAPKPAVRAPVQSPKPSPASVAASAKPAPSTDASAHSGAKPKVVAAPKNPEDLKRIRGIGNQNEGRLHGLGIWYYSQIAEWTPANVEWVSSYLAFRGRIQREKWIAQARELAAGRETAFSRRVAAGEVPTSKDDGSLGQKNIQIDKPST